MVTREQIDELKGIVRSLQKEAVIVEAEQGNVALDQILDTNRFDFNQAYGSAAWLDAMEHPEEHDDPEVLEYGIETFVYDRRRPFDIDRFADYVRTWPKEIIRAKGQLWSAQDPDMCYMFEQAGQQSMLSEQGKFIASAPDDIRARLIAENPEVMDDWDETCGDRETKNLLHRPAHGQAGPRGRARCLPRGLAALGCGQARERGKGRRGQPEEGLARP